MAARRIKYNQSNKIFSVFRNSDDLISMGHPKGLLIDYATFQGKNIFMIQPNGFNKGYKDYDINKLADELVNAVLHVSKRYKISLTSYIVKYITSVAYNSIERAYRALYVFEQYLKKIPPTSILVPAFGRFDARVLSIAGKNTGHRIVGSTHGGNVGFYRHSAWYNVDMLCCDDYLVPTRNAALAMGKYAKSYRLSKTYMPSFVSLDTNKLKKQFDILSRTKRNNVKSIMVMEYPNTPILPLEPMATGPLLTHITLKLGKLIKKAGLRSIIKIHPDRYNESKDMYESFYDEVEPKRFEDIHEKADTLIFMDITSTTFPFSLMTDHRIVAFSTIIHEYIAKEYIDDIYDRVCVVPSRFVNGKFEFDEEKLFEILDSGDKRLNYNIVEKLYFN